MLGITDFKIWNAVTNDLANSKARHGTGGGPLLPQHEAPSDTWHKCVTHSNTLTSNSSTSCYQHHTLLSITGLPTCDAEPLAFLPESLWRKSQTTTKLQGASWMFTKENPIICNTSISSGSYTVESAAEGLFALEPCKVKPQTVTLSNVSMMQFHSNQTKTITTCQRLARTFFNQASIQLWKNPEKQVWSNCITVQSQNFRYSSDLRHVFVLRHILATHAAVSFPLQTSRSRPFASTFLPDLVLLAFARLGPAFFMLQPFANCICLLLVSCWFATAKFGSKSKQINAGLSSIIHSWPAFHGKGNRQT